MKVLNNNASLWSRPMMWSILLSNRRFQWVTLMLRIKGNLEFSWKKYLTQDNSSRGTRISPTTGSRKSKSPQEDFKNSVLMLSTMWLAKECSLLTQLQELLGAEEKRLLIWMKKNNQVSRIPIGLDSAERKILWNLRKTNLKANKMFMKKKSQVKVKRNKAKKLKKIIEENNLLLKMRNKL